MTGFDDNSGNSQMRLLDSSHNMIGTQALSGTGNTPTTTVLSTSATGQVFFTRIRFECR